MLFGNTGGNVAEIIVFFSDPLNPPPFFSFFFFPIHLIVENLRRPHAGCTPLFMLLYNVCQSAYNGQATGSLLAFTIDHSLSGRRGRSDRWSPLLHCFHHFPALFALSCFCSTVVVD
ncbi:hypothetical protein T07_8071 [Trichinella nelsoni]|uniref:Uncharacterized protein n=1 Tax=Trichinella nelsoni TaxID=6336 RepID=A0A0V0SDS9_9BILA|nr:hypothetical protein T07_8071 [Trichinella nelsoni]